MSNKQLIVSPFTDVNAAAVNWGLQIEGFRPVWLKSASLSDNVIDPVSMFLTEGGFWGLEGGLDPSRFTSIWHRRPRPRKDFVNAHPSDQAFLSGEWRAFEANYWAVCERTDDTLWVNRPAAAVMAENKAVQLEIATQCGLACPDTLISNDPEAIRGFLNKYGKIVYKPFIPHGWKDVDTGKLFQTPATIVDHESVFEDESLEMCPGIYQPYIEKVEDIRVTIIGGFMFPVRIVSSTGDAFTDWRPAAIMEDRMHVEACSLPQALETKLRAVMKKLDIVYGAIDLVTDNTGECYFLEVNQSGQFLFVERWLPELPLLQAMCAMLAEGRTDFCMNSCSNVSFRAYQVTEEHQRWLENVREVRRFSDPTGSSTSLEGRMGSAS